jgi:predicted Zn-dependent protease
MIKYVLNAAVAVFVALGIGMAHAQDVSRDFDWSLLDARMAQAREAMDAEDWVDAARLLVAVVADAPDNADAYAYLGRSYRQLGEPEQALIYYVHALRLRPDHRGALVELGTFYLDMNKLPEAVELLARLARVCGKDCEAYRALETEMLQHRAAHPRG